MVERVDFEELRIADLPAIMGENLWINIKPLSLRRQVVFETFPSCV